MNRVKPVTQDNAEASVKQMYDALQKKLGKVPNIFLNMGNSAPALSAFLKLNELCDQTSLPQKLREQIALTCAQTNTCSYCLSAHTIPTNGHRSSTH